MIGQEVLWMWLWEMMSFRRAAEGWQAKARLHHSEGQRAHHATPGHSVAEVGAAAPGEDCALCARPCLLTVLASGAGCRRIDPLSFIFTEDSYLKLAGIWFTFPALLICLGEFLQT